MPWAASTITSSTITSSAITTTTITTTTIISTDQKESPMMNNMMDWMTGGMGIVSLLIIVVLVLAAAALVKYLFSSR
jgi:hypothetical protein